MEKWIWSFQMSTEIEKDKKEKDGDILEDLAGNQDLIMIVVLLAGFYLFKDEIMGIFNDVSGSLGDVGGGDTATDVSGDGEAYADIGDDSDMVSADDRREMHKRARGKHRRRDSNFVIANVNPW